MLTPAENLHRVLNGERPEWIPVECHGDDRRGDGSYALVAHRDALAPRAGGSDLWGVRWAGTAEALPYPVEHPATSLAQALTLAFPDVEDPFLWQEVAPRIRTLAGRSLVIARQVCALFERYTSLVGMETALVGLIDEPEQAAELLRRIADWQLQAADRYIAAGVQAGRISDDYGAQAALLVSPRVWRRLIRPQLARLVERYQRAGLPVVLHSCGHLMPIMDDLIELGFAALNIQSNANDLVALKQRYGRRFCVWGGISTQGVLTHGSPDEVRAAVRQAVADLGVDGGLILEPDQWVAIPEENLQAFFETAHVTCTNLDR